MNILALSALERYPSEGFAMPIGIFFWAIFLFVIIFGGFWWRNGAGWSYGNPGGYGLMILLIFLLGWAEFGFILQGGRAPFH